MLIVTVAFNNAGFSSLDAVLAQHKGLPDYLTDNPMPDGGKPWGTMNSTNTNQYRETPDTGVTRYYDWTVSKGRCAPDGFEMDCVMANNQYPGPTVEVSFVHSRLRSSSYLTKRDSRPTGVTTSKSRSTTTSLTKARAFTGTESCRSTVPESGWTVFLVPLSARSRLSRLSPTVSGQTCTARAGGTLTTRRNTAAASKAQ
jgi:hypothetical protein